MLGLSVFVKARETIPVMLAYVASVYAQVPVLHILFSIEQCNHVGNVAQADSSSRALSS